VRRGEMVSRRHCARAVSAPSSSISAVSSPIDPAAPGVASAFHGIIAGRSPLRPAWGPSAPASRGVCAWHCPADVMRRNVLRCSA